MKANWTPEKENARTCAYDIIDSNLGAGRRSPEAVGQLLQWVEHCHDSQQAYEAALGRNNQGVAEAIDKLRSAYCVRTWKGKDGKLKKKHDEGRMEAAWGHCTNYLTFFRDQIGNWAFATPEEQAEAIEFMNQQSGIAAQKATA